MGVSGRLRSIREGTISIPDDLNSNPNLLEEDWQIRGMLEESFFDYCELNQLNEGASDLQSVSFQSLLEAAVDSGSKEALSTLVERLKNGEVSSNEAIRNIRLVKHRLSKMRWSIGLGIFVSIIVAIIYYFYRNIQLSKMSKQKKNEWLKEAIDIRKVLIEKRKEAEKDGLSINKLDKQVSKLDKYIERFRHHSKS